MIYLGNISHIIRVKTLFPQKKKRERCWVGELGISMLEGLLIRVKQG